MCLSCTLELALRAPVPPLDPRVRFSLAQSQRVLTPSTPVGAAIGGLVILALAVLVVVLIAACAWFYQRRRGRLEEARELEGQLSAAFLRDPRLAGVVLKPTVRIPLSPEKPTSILIEGSISTLELRTVVLQIAREATKYSEEETVLEDRLTVRPTVPPVAA